MVRHPPHGPREPARVLFIPLPCLITHLLPQVCDIDVTLGVARDHHHLHAGKHGRGRVGPVRGHGDDADVAVHVSSTAVVASDAKETRVFPLLQEEMSVRTHVVVVGGGVGLHMSVTHQ